MKQLSNVKSLHSQRGLTMISWIFVILIIAFCGIFAFRIVPMYAENTYVVQALKSLTDAASPVEEMSDAEIIKKLNSFYLINGVRSDGPQHIVIDRKSKNLIIKVDYESRANLFYNIDVVTVFKNHLDAAKKDKCCKPLDEPGAKY